MTDTRSATPADTATTVKTDESGQPAGPREGSGEPLSTSDIARGGDDRLDTRTAETARSAPAGEVPDAKVAPLFSEDAASELRDRWTDVQAGFVDEPRDSVKQADSLVAEVMKRLADGFATERQALERQWSSGEQASTEDLRVALRRYRSFFDRLLSI